MLIDFSERNNLFVIITEKGTIAIKNLEMTYHFESFKRNEFSKSFLCSKQRWSTLL